MARLKIASFNVEWLVLAFGSASGTAIVDRFPGGSVGGVRHPAIDDVRDMCRRVAGVVRALKAKIIALQEAPPHAAQLEAFVAEFLEGDYQVLHSNARPQAISVLVHKSLAGKVETWMPPGVTASALWNGMAVYDWGAIDQPRRHDFFRRPLMLKVTPKPGVSFVLMVVHTKSKFSKLRSRQQWEKRDEAAVRDAIAARRDLSAEALRLREVMEDHLANPDHSPNLVVMGDMNDGPLAELMEREFLLHNVVDQLVGSVLYPNAHFRHAMDEASLRTEWSVAFSDPVAGDATVLELIDHILVSPAISARKAGIRLVSGSGQVEHAAWEAFNGEDATHAGRQWRPSDHRPVSAMLEIG